MPLELTDLDRRIWDEELADFVPHRIFDVHTHIYRWAFHTDPAKEHGPYRQFVGDKFQEAHWELLDACDRLLLPGRHVARLAFPLPLHRIAISAPPIALWRRKSLRIRTQPP